MQQDLLVNFLFAYLVHSSVLLGCAAIGQRASFFCHRRLSELIWRFALFAAFVTAGLQVTWNHFSIDDAANRPVFENSVVMPTAAKPSEIQSPLMQEDKRAASPVSSGERASVPRSAITLPDSSRSYARLFLISWCVFAGFSIAMVALSVAYLNRKLNAMPELEHRELQQFANSLIASRKKIVIRIGDAWQSPLLAPNGSVFLPTWALSTLSQEQCQAMLAHEIAHWRRADHLWRLAYQVIQRLFFFQIFNRYAVRQLDLLAEIDCDDAALQHQPAHSYTELLLECAQRGVRVQPHIALAMARPSSLLQRVQLLIKEDNMRTSHFSKNTLFLFAVVAVTGLSAVSYAMPRFLIDAAKGGIEKPAISLPQRTPLLAKPVQEGTPIMPTTVSVKETKDSIANPLNSQNSIQVLPEVTSDTRLSQAHQAWKTNAVLAFKLFSELANEGSAEAQEALGEMYWYGEGTSFDQRQAHYWIGKAAAQGRARAQQFLEMFAERDRRQSELRFYLEEFDGGNLKWTERMCPAPDLSESNMSVTQLKASLEILNKKVDCYNQYVSNMKTSLQTLSFIPKDLQRLMREEEINQARWLAETRYYEFGLKEKSMNEALQTTLSQRFTQHAKNGERARDNFDANGYWAWREHYDRQLSPQMTSNPKVEPIADRSSK